MLTKYGGRWQKVAAAEAVGGSNTTFIQTHFHCWTKFQNEMPTELRMALLYTLRHVQSSFHFHELFCTMHWTWCVGQSASSSFFSVASPPIVALVRVEQAIDMIIVFENKSRHDEISINIPFAQMGLLITYCWGWTFAGWAMSFAHK